MNAAIEQHFSLKRTSTVGGLIAAVGDRSIVYEAIANDEVYFDLERDLVQDDRSPVYQDRKAWELDKALRSAPPISVGRTGAICIQTGASLMYDGSRVRVMSEDLLSVWIRHGDGQLTSLSRESIPALIEAGRLTAVPPDEDPTPGIGMVANASPERQQRALEWYNRLLPHLNGSVGGALPNRTFRDKVKSYREAEATSGCGLAGLLDDFALRGNRTPRLMPEVEIEIAQALETEFGTPLAPNVATTLRLLNHRLKEKGLPPLGRKALVHRIGQLPPEQLADARYGHKVANAVRPPHQPSELPPSGDRAFEVGYIDSTQVDLSLISDRTNAKLPMAWLTVLLNGKPSFPLAWHLALHKPDTSSVLMTARDCVRRHNRLPDLIVYDLGSEHQTVSFDVLKATYKVDFLKRPRGNPRFSAAMESFFNAFNQYFIHQLEGNTK